MVVSGHRNLVRDEICQSCSCENHGHKSPYAQGVKGFSTLQCQPIPFGMETHHRQSFPHSLAPS